MQRPTAVRLAFLPYRNSPAPNSPNIAASLSTSGDVNWTFRLGSRADFRERGIPNPMPLSRCFLMVVVAALPLSAHWPSTHPPPTFLSLSARLLTPARRAVYRAASRWRYATMPLQCPPRSWPSSAHEGRTSPASEQCAICTKLMTMLLLTAHPHPFG